MSTKRGGGTEPAFEKGGKSQAGQQQQHTRTHELVRPLAHVPLQQAAEQPPGVPPPSSWKSKQLSVYLTTSFPVLFVTLDITDYTLFSLSPSFHILSCFFG